MLLQMLVIIINIANCLHQLIHYSRYFICHIIVHFREFILCPFFIGFDLLVGLCIVILGSTFGKLNGLSNISEVAIKIIVRWFYTHQVLVKFRHYASYGFVHDFGHIVPLLRSDFENCGCRLIDFSVTPWPCINVTIFVCGYLQRRYALFTHFII